MAIDQATLKVMTDEDYLAMDKNGVGARSPRPGQGNPATTESFKKYILPAIEQEVNQGKHFSQFRQIYSALIMAAWFKNKLKNTILNESYLNKSKIKGADTPDKAIREKIYNEYIKAFKAGAYNVIKREFAGTGTGSPVKGSVYVPGQRITKRAYFSGGAVVTDIDERVTDGTHFADTATVNADLPRSGEIVEQVAGVPVIGNSMVLIDLGDEPAVPTLGLSEVERKAGEKFLQVTVEEEYSPKVLWLMSRYLGDEQVNSGFNADMKKLGEMFTSRGESNEAKALVMRMRAIAREMIFNKYPEAGSDMEIILKAWQAGRLNIDKIFPEIVDIMRQAFDRAVRESRLRSAVGYDFNPKEYARVSIAHKHREEEKMLDAPPRLGGYFSRPEKTPIDVIRETIEILVCGRILEPKELAGYLYEEDSADHKKGRIIDQERYGKHLEAIGRREGTLMFGYALAKRIVKKGAAGGGKAAHTNGGFAMQTIGGQEEVNTARGKVKFSREKALTEWKNILGVELVTVSLKF